MGSYLDDVLGPASGTRIASSGLGAPRRRSYLDDVLGDPAEIEPKKPAWDYLDSIIPPAEPFQPTGNAFADAAAKYVGDPIKRGAGIVGNAVRGVGEKFGEALHEIVPQAFEQAPAIAAQYYSGLHPEILSEALTPRETIPTMGEMIRNEGLGAEGTGLSREEKNQEGYGYAIGRELSAGLADLATPTNAAIMAATGGLGSLAGKGLAVGATPAAARVGQAAGLAARGLSAGFATQMAPAAYDSLKAAGELGLEQGLTPEVAASFTQALPTAAFAYMAGKHALAPKALPFQGPRAPKGTSPLDVEAAVVEQAKAQAVPDFAEEIVPVPEPGRVNWTPEQEAGYEKQFNRENQPSPVPDLDFGPLEGENVQTVQTVAQGLPARLGETPRRVQGEVVPERLALPQPSLEAPAVEQGRQLSPVEAKEVRLLEEKVGGLEDAQLVERARFYEQRRLPAAAEVVQAELARRAAPEVQELAEPAGAPEIGRSTTPEVPVHPLERMDPAEQAFSPEQAPIEALPEAAGPGAPRPIPDLRQGEQRQAERRMEDAPVEADLRVAEERRIQERRDAIRKAVPDASDAAVEHILKTETERDVAMVDARTDMMTGLRNRRALDEDMAGHEGPVVSMDLAGLGFVNDNLGGHTAGDSFLKAAAKALLDEPSVRAYRAGEKADEFILLAKSAESAKAASENIQRRFEAAEFSGTVDGKPVKYAGGRIDYGIGTEGRAATERFKHGDDLLKAGRDQAIQQGLRSSVKGQRPPGLREVTRPGLPEDRLAAELAEPVARTAELERTAEARAGERAGPLPPVEADGGGAPRSVPQAPGPPPRTPAAEKAAAKLAKARPKGISEPYTKEVTDVERAGLPRHFDEITEGRLEAPDKFYDADGNLRPLTDTQIHQLWEEVAQANPGKYPGGADSIMKSQDVPPEIAQETLGQIIGLKKGNRTATQADIAQALKARRGPIYERFLDQWRTNEIDAYREQLGERVDATSFGPEPEIGAPVYSVRPAPGQRGFEAADDVAPKAPPKKEAPKQSSMFGEGAIMGKGVEAKVTEGRESKGDLFTQDARAAEKADKGKQASLPEPEASTAPGEVRIVEGRFGPMTKGKVRAEADGQASNWFDTEAEARADLKRSNEARAAGVEHREKDAAALERAKAGQATDADITTLTGGRRTISRESAKSLLRDMGVRGKVMEGVVRRVPGRINSSGTTMMDPKVVIERGAAYLAEQVGRGAEEASAGTARVKQMEARETATRLESAWQQLMKADPQRAREIVGSLPDVERAQLLDRLNAAPGDNLTARAALERSHVLRTISGEEGMAVEITKGEKGFHATLRDTEAGQTVSTSIHPTMEAAEAAARKGLKFRADKEAKPSPQITESQVKAALPSGRVTKSPDGYVVDLPGGRRIKVETSGGIAYDAEAFKAGRPKGLSDAERIVGSWQPVDRGGIIRLAEGADMATLDHEVMHSAVKMALHPREIEAVLDHYKLPREKAAQAEETAADGYARFAEDLRKARAEHANGNIIQRLVWKVREFAQRLSHAFKPSWEGAFREVESGRAFERGEKQAARVEQRGTPVAREAYAASKKRLSPAAEKAARDAEVWGPAGPPGEGGARTATARPAEPKIEPSKTPDADVLKTMKDLGATPSGKLLHVPELREKLSGQLPGKAFDEAMLDLRDRGLVELQAHPVPSQLTPAERSSMVVDTVDMQIARLKANNGMWESEAKTRAKLQDRYEMAAGVRSEGKKFSVAEKPVGPYGAMMRDDGTWVLEDSKGRQRPETYRTEKEAYEASHALEATERAPVDRAINRLPFREKAGEVFDDIAEKAGIYAGDSSAGVRFAGLTAEFDVHGIHTGGRVHLNPLHALATAMRRGAKSEADILKATAEEMVEVAIHEAAHDKHSPHGAAHEAEMARIRKDIGGVGAVREYADQLSKAIGTEGLRVLQRHYAEAPGMPKFSARPVPEGEIKYATAPKPVGEQRDSLFASAINRGEPVVRRGGEAEGSGRALRRSLSARTRESDKDAIRVTDDLSVAHPYAESRAAMEALAPDLGHIAGDAADVMMTMNKRLRIAAKFAGLSTDADMYAVALPGNRVRLSLPTILDVARERVAKDFPDATDAVRKERTLREAARITVSKLAHEATHVKAATLLADAPGLAAGLGAKGGHGKAFYRLYEQVMRDLAPDLSQMTARLEAGFTRDAETLNKLWSVSNGSWEKAGHGLHRARSVSRGHGGDVLQPGRGARGAVSDGPPGVAGSRSGVGDRRPGDLPAGTQPAPGLDAGAPLRGREADVTPERKLKPIPPTPEQRATYEAGKAEGGRTTGKPPDEAVNLDRASSDQDIRKIISRVADARKEELGEAKSYRSWEEAREKAVESGITEADFKRMAKEGPVTDHIIEAGRMLRTDAFKRVQETLKALNEAAKEGKETGDLEIAYESAVNKAAGVLWSTTRAGAEAGRALAIHRKMAEGMTEQERLYRRIAKGRPGMSEEFARRFLATDIYDNAALSILLKSEFKPTYRAMAYEWWINGLLSGPPTHLANTIGNTLSQSTRIAEKVFAGGLDAARVAAFGGSRERFVGEAFADMQGIREGLAKAMVAGRAAWGDEMQAFRMDGKVEHAPKIPGKAGTIIRTPTRLLSTADAMAKALIEIRESRSLAYRKARMEGKKSPAEISQRVAEILSDLEHHPDILKGMKVEADYQTFTTALGKFGNMFMGVRDADPTGISKVIVPFFRTPLNITKYTLERTPLNFIRLAHLAKKGELKGGKLSEELAKATMGTAIGVGLAMMANEGLLTGGGPSDHKENETKRATGWQPYSLHVGNQYYSIKRLEPFATIAGFAADMIETKDEKTQGDLVNKILGSVAENLTNKTFLHGLESAFMVLSDPKRNASTWAKGLEGSLVPAIVGRAAQAVDPTFRQTSALDGSALAARIPGLSTFLEPRRSAGGEPVMRESSAVERFVSPLPRSTQKGPEADLEREFLDADFIPSRPSKSVTVPGSGGRKVVLSDEEYAVYVEADRQTTERLRKVVKDPLFKRMDPLRKKTYLRGAYQKANDRASHRVAALPSYRAKIADARRKIQANV